MTDQRSGARNLTGTITLAQERRFQLVDDHGIAHLFTLAANASFDPAELRELARTGCRVGVSYTEDAEVLTHIAHEISTRDGKTFNEKR